MRDNGVMQLDHIIIAAPNLEQAKADFFEKTGVEPVDGGPHTNGGTCNALVAFSRGVYLELICPDPNQKIEGTQAERIAELPEPVVLHWAVQETGLSSVAEKAKGSGLAPGPVVPMERVTPAGDTLAWELCMMGGHDLGGVMPFFIDWLDSTHPSKTSPEVGALTEFVVSAPADSALAGFLDPVPDYSQLTEGGPAISFKFESPNGVVSFSQSNPRGFGSF